MIVLTCHTSSINPDNLDFVVLSGFCGNAHCSLRDRFLKEFEPLTGFRTRPLNLYRRSCVTKKKIRKFWVSNHSFETYHFLRENTRAQSNKLLLRLKGNKFLTCSVAPPALFRFARSNFDEAMRKDGRFRDCSTASIRHLFPVNEKKGSKGHKTSFIWLQSRVDAACYHKHENGAATKNGINWQDIILHIWLQSSIGSFLVRNLRESSMTGQHEQFQRDSVPKTHLHADENKKTYRLQKHKKEETYNIHLLREENILNLYQEGMRKYLDQRPIQKKKNQEWNDLRSSITIAADEALGKRKKKHNRRGLKIWNQDLETDYREKESLFKTQTQTDYMEYKRKRAIVKKKKKERKSESLVITTHLEASWHTHNCEHFLEGSDINTSTSRLSQPPQSVCKRP
ncbi:hypothetical protein C0J52_03387 [Blattella germanica]|nr:hypothetical protein C0J52_03387 [Blattella germanica]